MGGFRCRICKAADCSTILAGCFPLAADVRTEPSNDIPVYPLRVVRCASCGHIQLEAGAPADIYGDYLFTPSFTAEFSAYLDAFCELLDHAFNFEKGRNVLEIGSGNGSVLKRLKGSGWNVLGIEPSGPMVEASRRQGVVTIHDYFGPGVLEEVRKTFGRPDAVILRHVLEHLEHLDEIAALLRQLLEDGLLIIEVPYVLKTIQEARFYDFFHEHLSYFSVTALNSLLTMGGFNIHRVYEGPEGGGSILIFANSDNERRTEDNVESYLAAEKDLLSAERVAAFSNRIPTYISRLKTTVYDAKARGKTVAAWGAGQRGCTLIAHCGFQSDSLRYVIDANENYWWRYVPGTDIQIVPPGYYREHMVDTILIFATGYADSIMAANRAFENSGGTFVKISPI